MADPTIYEYSIQDDQGIVNRSALYVAYDGATETVDSQVGAWTAFGGLIDACVDGAIVGGRITIPLIPDGALKATATAGNNANQVMVVNFKNDFNSYLTPVMLPSYKEALLTAELLPDLADVALAALTAAIIAGSGATFPNSRDLHDLSAVKDAFLTVRKLRGARRKLRSTP